ncbi:Vi polysaccharide biosynthesis UDP-N-acetylglucosamine C-6 dehydrogenase TviB [Pseudoalteromonas fuliginea]|uniref:Vi polysaccharide biosynthesis protein VipA/TviB n=1 Tax=Pseudoalteromonas fuliginea TaxID=1872678 RepID=A0ABD3Y6J8_9GAMM|nr:Vi polysaccharide biosynthesis UDP-N-acetylglucosamine C-6 dehydrogenase TviB [Pseudoalteromonas fuliginea]KDC49456.1 Vi polysaccharide biosynthesis protein VipA/TviB [Pseudoalteromonas fuliginea]KJZ27732.1 Vi polysaccharide biosynthesis protein VipA/TviB [Pseudoalteromonas fuliginea]
MIANQGLIKIGVIGLGYVGLPLAVEFGKKFSVLGFDVNKNRIAQLESGTDLTLEVSDEELKESLLLNYSYSVSDLKSCNVYIVTVPTPIDQHKQPDLTPLIKASEMLGSVIKYGDIIIYESTVYPGATEEVCLPVVEHASGLKFNKDFYAGYSPERINPGDKEHRVTNILKVTSGSTPEVAEKVDQLYKSIITAGTYKASSIKVAEAAKVIENTQRDVNIALINELSIIFNKLDIDTLEVLEAAGTKWNFLPFRPGLVGGHCIGVDPYYLTHKAQSVGYHPEMILAGRRLNDGMGKHVVSELVKKMLKKRIHVDGANVLVMGLTFKENCPDLRNTKVVDIVCELKEYNINVDIIDPWCSNSDAQHEYGLSLVTEYKENNYDAVILAVGHNQFKVMGTNKIRSLGKENHVLYDLKYILPKQDVDMRL